MRKFLMLTFFILSAGNLSRADEFRRVIFLEWEGIEDARFYDVEIKRKSGEKDDGDAKGKIYMTNKSEWSGKLQFGYYTMRVRSLDKRKVPGEWSETQDFYVGLDSPKILQPKPEEKVLTDAEDTAAVEFRWQPVNGAEKYKFEVTSEDGKIRETTKTRDTNVSFKLPVATKYSWHVTALSNRGVTSDRIGAETFTLWGAKLEMPQVSEPNNGFVRELEWQRPNYSDNFDYALTRYNEQTQKWDVMSRQVGEKNSKIPFAEDLPGGQYKLTLRANAPYRQSSKAKEVAFKVVNGNRSPAAEENATIRQSIERTSGWFVVASYLLTNINYAGTNSDNGSATALDVSIDGALGGTGRLGLGFLSEKTWGFLGIVDYSGFLINSRVYNFGSIEGNAIHRTPFGERSEIRQQIGAYYKELPVFIGTTLSTANGDAVTALGPHYGFEYWQAVSAKFGFQLNAHAYLNVVSVKTPNGKEMQPDLSFQLGFLGSYRLGKKTTGLMGYALRRDAISYKANNGDKNSSSVTGNYINLFLEWAL
jgi:hypothetical protein